MRLGLTNLAWDPSRDEAVAGLLARLGVDAIDVAPSKYFADVAAVREAEVRRVRDWWADRGIEITGMQSLLYGTQGLNLFGPPDVQQRMLAYLAAVCRVGTWLGATRLVFGSPANRNRAGLTDAEAWARALEFFGRLAEVAAEAGVTICLEGVHPHYGANFMTDTASSPGAEPSVRGHRAGHGSGAAQWRGHRGAAGRGRSLGAAYPCQREGPGPVGAGRRSGAVGDAAGECCGGGRPCHHGGSDPSLGAGPGGVRGDSCKRE